MREEKLKKERPLLYKKIAAYKVFVNNMLISLRTGEMPHQKNRLLYNRRRYFLDENGVLRYKTVSDKTPLVLWDPERIYEVMNEYHVAEDNSHLNSNVLYKKIADDFYWKGMRPFVNDCIRSCKVCQRRHTKFSCSSYENLVSEEFSDQDSNDETTLDFSDIDDEKGKSRKRRRKADHREVAQIGSKEVSCIPQIIPENAVNNSENTQSQGADSTNTEDPEIVEEWCSSSLANPESTIAKKDDPKQKLYSCRIYIIPNGKMLQQVPSGSKGITLSPKAILGNEQVQDPSVAPDTQQLQEESHSLELPCISEESVCSTLETIEQEDEIQNETESEQKEADILAEAADFLHSDTEDVEQDETDTDSKVDFLHIQGVEHIDNIHEDWDQVEVTPPLTIKPEREDEMCSSASAPESTTVSQSSDAYNVVASPSNSNNQLENKQNNRLEPEDKFAASFGDMVKTMMSQFAIPKQMKIAKKVLDIIQKEM